jgi:hypothetical protein
VQPALDAQRRLESHLRNRRSTRRSILENNWQMGGGQMNAEEQRIAIAEACGLTIVSDGIMHHLTPCGKKTERDPEGFLLKECPDYLNDLNAMHEAEKTLNQIKAAEYARALTAIAWQSEQPVFAPMTATAAQRAEAFLKTIKKWNSNKI